MTVLLVISMVLMSFVKAQEILLVSPEPMEVVSDEVHSESILQETNENAGKSYNRALGY